MALTRPSVDEVFNEAIRQSPGKDRAAYLDEVCGDDAELRERVERLLRAFAEAGSFLESPAAELAATADALTIAGLPGLMIGPYKLLKQIGEGGFGVVFLAEQERPLRRKVALKVIKPGMDTRQVIARFEAERQALAMMDHPNIAKVYDAGASENGRPYFVMELIQGIPITEYCDQCNITTRERLELFVTVCQAVQHAHQKGVIHRDIKPTNVLVAIQDGQPIPKIIDFGVAKALSHRITEHMVTTTFAQMVGTPLYMSPEQAELSPLGVDTRTDIYSLGVLLYELLTGATPFDKDRLHAASYDELRRIIRQEEPPRPSARLSTLAADRAATIAERRRTDARRLRQTVRGELDWIVMKCLEKDRNRRYETANCLAADIERHLRDEPVQACPPSAGYRVRKFARRNKATLFAVSAGLGTLLVAVVGLAISNRLITAERNEKAAALAEKELALTQAEFERQRAHDNFMKARIAIRELITRPAMGFDEWQELPPALRKRFSQEAVKFYNSLIQRADPNPSLQFDAAVSYVAIGTLHTGAGDPDEAAKAHRKSIEIIEPLVAEYPGRRSYRGHLAWSLYNLGCVLVQQNRNADAQPLVERAADIYEGLLPGQGHEDYRNQLALCYSKLSEICRQAGDSRAAIEFLRREIALLDTLTNELTADHSRDKRFAEANQLLGQLLASSAQEVINDALQHKAHLSATNTDD
jgi:serine/threonine protein kinase